MTESAEVDNNDDINDVEIMVVDTDPETKTITLWGLQPSHLPQITLILVPVFLDRCW